MQGYRPPRPRRKKLQPGRIFKGQLIMQRANPGVLDLRYKINRLWLEQEQRRNQLPLPF